MGAPISDEQYKKYAPRWLREQSPMSRDEPPSVPAAPTVPLSTDVHEGWKARSKFTLWSGPEPTATTAGTVGTWGADADAESHGWSHLPRLGHCWSSLQSRYGRAQAGSSTQIRKYGRFLNQLSKPPNNLTDLRPQRLQRAQELRPRPRLPNKHCSSNQARTDLRSRPNRVRNSIWNFRPL